MKRIFVTFLGAIKTWLSQKPKTWSNLSEAERQKASSEARAKLENVDGTPFKDVFGSSAVNPGSSQIGATTNQRGLGAVMSRRTFEPRQRPEDVN
jgi:hypothetical protein